ncbi:hypothetical protein QNN00_25915 [Bacillus velezensis]|nr:hypothetical protein [Bacillus velezensis]
MVNGDTYSRARWVSYAVGTVVTSVVGTKGVGAVSKTGTAAKVTTKVKTKKQIRNSTKSDNGLKTNR